MAVSLIRILFLIFVLFFLAGCSVKEKETAVVENNNTEEVVAPAPEIEKEVVVVNKINISADDERFLPYRVNVKKGERVELTFNFNDSNVNIRGLQIKSDYFNVIYRKKNMQPKIVEFTADKSFSYSSYIPDTNLLQAVGKVEVS